MIYKGKVYKFRDDVNTDEIIPARYLNTSSATELAEHCMEDIDSEFPNKVHQGDIMVAGKNFGCGSSREHAPVAIKASGVSCVIAKSFARIFYRNCFNIGLPIFICENIDKINNNDIIEVDSVKGKIKLKSGEEIDTSPIPEFMQELIDSGGLIEYIKNKYIDKD